MTVFILSWNLPELVNCFVPVGHKAAALRGCQADFYQPLLRLERTRLHCLVKTDAVFALNDRPDAGPM